MSSEHMQSNIGQARHSMQTEQHSTKSNKVFPHLTSYRQQGKQQYTARDYVHKSDWFLAMSSCFLWKCDRWCSCVSDGSVFQTWEALTEKADWLKVLFLKGTITVTSHGRPCGSAAICLVFCLTKVLSGGGARPFRILNTRHVSVYCTRLSQLRSSCFLRM